MRLVGTGLMLAAVCWLVRRGTLLAPSVRTVGEPHRRRRTLLPSVAGTRGRLRGVLVRLRQRRSERLADQEVPVLLEAVARSLRSGTSTVGALAESTGQLTSPLREQVEDLVRAVELGYPLADALDRWRRDSPTPGVVLASASLALGSASGGARAQAVEAVAATIRERAVLRSEVASLSTQARASAVVMAATPLVFLSFVSAVGGDTLGFLVSTRFGLLCLASGLLLEALGATWMVLLTRAAL